MEDLIDEKTALDAKLNNLNDFIRTNELFKKMPRIEQGLIMEQVFSMAAYSSILKDRISLFDGAKPPLEE